MTVFAVLAHDDPEMLARLSARLAPHRVFVHIDARRPLAPFAAAVRSQPHVQLIPDRVTVNWGGLSQVDATMRLYREIVTQVEPSEQIVLLSGHCYPLHPVADIVRALDEASNRLHLRGVRYSEIRDRTRTRRFHFYDQFPVRQSGIRRIAYAVPRKLLQAVAPLLPRRIPGEEGFVLGSQWTVLTADAITTAVIPAYESLRRRLRMTFAPEEIFFATAIFSSPYAADTQEGRASEYAGERMAGYPNLHLLDDSMVKTYTLADWPEIAASKAAFVRKVSTAASAALLDAIDEVGRVTVP
jgi:hypothetical protein